MCISSDIPTHSRSAPCSCRLGASSTFCVPCDALYFCAGDQTGESLTVLALAVLAGLRVSRCCPLPSAFMT